MSGYGGRPPSGWEDPYGGSQNWEAGGAYGQQYGYTQPGYGYGPPGVSPHQSTGNGSTIAALVCNAVAVTLCCNIVALPGLITAAIALGRAHSDPESTRRLTIWSWSLFAASVLVGIILVVIWIAFGVMSDPEYSSSDGI
ncbi:hypothetical protein AB0C21_25095 [Spirillospora sp. NPDC049024]